MQIRPATSDDYEALEKLWAQQNAHQVELQPNHVQHTREYLSKDAFAEAIGDVGREIAVLEHDDELVAAAMLASRVIDGKYTVPRKVVHIHEIVVTADERRSGHGRALLEYIERWARIRSLEAIELNVWGNNADAMSFYSALGFAPLRYELHKRLD